MADLHDFMPAGEAATIALPMVPVAPTTMILIRCLPPQTAPSRLHGQHVRTREREARGTALPRHRPELRLHLLVQGRRRAVERPGVAPLPVEHEQRRHRADVAEGARPSSGVPITQTQGQRPARAASLRTSASSDSTAMAITTSRSP